MTALAAPLPASSRTPWYRQRWPWLLMLGPAVVVVAGFVTLLVAFRTDDGLVADDYYKRGLAINQTLDRSARGADLGLAATVDIAGDGAVVAAVRGRGPLPPIVRLRLIHPTRAGLDQAVELALGPEGRYAGRIEPLPHGRRLVVIDTPDWKLGPIETTGDATHVALPTPAR